MCIALGFVELIVKDLEVGRKAHALSLCIDFRIILRPCRVEAWRELYRFEKSRGKRGTAGVEEAADYFVAFKADGDFVRVASLGECAGACE